MKSNLHRIPLVAAATLAALTVFAAPASAAKPKEGPYHWEQCSNEPGGPCPALQINFSVKAGKTTKIKGFTYSNGFTCGDVTVKPIKVKGSGKFDLDGVGQNPVGGVPLEIHGKFVSKTKAKGTLTIHADCSSAEPIDFTAKRQHASAGRAAPRVGP